MKINSGHERQLARLGQAELARILLSHSKNLQVRGSELGLITLMSVANTSFSSAAEHEAILSVGVDAKIGGTGHVSIAAAKSVRLGSTPFQTRPYLVSTLGRHFTYALPDNGWARGGRRCTAVSREI